MLQPFVVEDNSNAILNFVISLREGFVQLTADAVFQRPGSLNTF